MAERKTPHPGRTHFADDETLAHIARLERERAELVGALRASTHALRSYQYGNGSPDLAEAQADHNDALLSRLCDGQSAEG